MVTLVDRVWVDAVIEDVRFIPGLKRNLTSEGVLTSKGMQIVKNSSFAEVFHDGILMLHALKTVNALYHIEMVPAVSEANSAASLQIWHQHLAHINKSFLN